MIPFRGRGILLDIEGTTSSVSFVYDVMFPFVRRVLDRYLDDHWGEPALIAACEQIARDASQTKRAGDKEWIRGDVLRLMDGDVKATGLKQLQGLIWEAGFASGELSAHVYDDVPPALRNWHSRGISLRIYSSGSIQAQKLFFGHTIAGNLLPLFSGHYDTTTGPKKEAASYRAIAADFGLPASEILFLSDVVAELDAARAAGMQTSLVIRPGNAAVADGHGHTEVFDFNQIDLSSPASIYLREHLAHVRTVLEQIGETRLATLIERVLSGPEGNFEAFLISNELWGGAGSIADGAGMSGSRDVRRRMIEAALIKLGEEQIKEGIVNRRTEMWVDAFRQWHRDGI